MAFSAAESLLLTLGSPSNDVDGLVVLSQGCKVLGLAVLAVALDLPQPHIVVTSSGRQTALSRGLEVRRVDGRVLVVPIDDEGRRLHCAIVPAAWGAESQLRSWLACRRALLVMGLVEDVERGSRDGRDSG